MTYPNSNTDTEHSKHKTPKEGRHGHAELPPRSSGATNSITLLLFGPKNKTPESGQNIRNELPKNGKLNLDDLDNIGTREWIVRELTRKPKWLEPLGTKRWTEGEAWAIALSWESDGWTLRTRTYPELLEAFPPSAARAIKDGIQKTVQEIKKTEPEFAKLPIKHDAALDLETLSCNEARAWLFRVLKHGPLDLKGCDEVKKYDKEISAQIAACWNENGQQLKHATIRQLKNAFIDPEIAFMIDYYRRRTIGVANPTPIYKIPKNKDLYLPSLNRQEAQAWITAQLRKGWKLQELENGKPICWVGAEARAVADKWKFDGKHLYEAPQEELSDVLGEDEAQLLVWRLVDTLKTPTLLENEFLELETLTVEETRSWLFREFERTSARISFFSSAPRSSEIREIMQKWDLDGAALKGASYGTLLAKLGSPKVAYNIYWAKENTVGVGLPENRRLVLADLNIEDTQRWLLRELGVRGVPTAIAVDYAEQWTRDSSICDGYSLKKATLRELEKVFDSDVIAIHVDKQRRMTANFFTNENRSVDLDTMDVKATREWLAREYGSWVRAAKENQSYFADLWEGHGSELKRMNVDEVGFYFHCNRASASFIVSRVLETHGARKAGAGRQ